MIKKKQAGVTLIELMVVIAIIGIISSIFYVNVRVNSQEEVRLTMEELTSNVRYIRNLSTSRTEHQFGVAEPQYPPGGYGLAVSDGDSYWLFADNGVTAGYQQSEDDIIGEKVVLSNSDYEISNPSNTAITFYFTYITENEISTNMGITADNDYVVRLRDPGPGYPVKGYEGYLRLGEQSEDNYTWGNLGKWYGVYTPPNPHPTPPPTRKEDPAILLLF